MSTGISWTDEVWNPVTGCSKVSEGCRNCYAAALAPRLAAMGKKGYTSLPWTAKNAVHNVFLHIDRLDRPLRWRKPRRVFVNSMSDLFHEQAPDEFIAQVFDIMARCPEHTFQVLTKRPARMAEFVAAYDPEALAPFPLPNVWLGTSVENQKAADERIPYLIRTPAAVRFLSCEPLLGWINLESWIPYAAVGWNADAYENNEERMLHWVIAGGESGPNHRSMDPAWPRSLRDQCVAASVPFFYKQSAGPRNEMDPYLDGEMWRQFPDDVVLKSGQVIS